MARRSMYDLSVPDHHPKINYLDTGDGVAMKRILTLTILKRELAHAAGAES
jgi:hypothetical protein